MEVTATNFRKHLFEVLDQSLNGEPVDIVYKGSRIRLTVPQNTSKLARAVRRETLLVPADSIVESDATLMKKLKKSWAASDKQL
jgi:antitoxin (DNA-binding transcriptional repressor) of toxin-antitoxin stability system